MSDSSGELRQKLNVAADLHGVVRTMKVMAASSIGKYERAVESLAAYDRAVRLGLAVSLREIAWNGAARKTMGSAPPVLHVIVFGSDQGLVGQFNDLIAEFAIATLAKLPASPVVWAVGERVHTRLGGAGLAMKGFLRLPNDVAGIAALVTQLQLRAETSGLDAERESLYVFHNRQSTGAVYEPKGQQLLPLDRAWRDTMAADPWPTKNVPQMLAESRNLFRAYLREHLFISLYRACAESLASENASRLMAMQRAEKNIDELTETLTRRFHQVRQSSIDEQLFDVLSGFEALSKQ